MKRLAAPALALALALAPACGGRGVATWPDAPVVIVSIDTLRADHLPAYGYASGSTPRLDSFARDAVVFEDAYSHCPLTLPSHVSLLTGVLPPRHGVRDNIGFRLGEDPPTLAERLGRAGWSTGAAVSAFVLRGDTGLGRGFAFYEDALEIQGGEESMGSLQRDGALTVAALERWLGGLGDARPFALLHLYEPHTPYSPPARHAGHGSAYDGEIAYADELVGRFLDALRSRSLYDDALVVVTSDHGEGLLDHGEAEHGLFLYREAVHVPLLVKLPGGVQGGTRVAGTVGLVDVAATVLDLVGQPASGLDGSSLRAELASGRAEPRRVYSETLYPRFHFGWSELYAATEGRFRYIRAPRSELYDLARDPGEKSNLAPERAASVAAMDAWLGERLAEDAGAEPEPVPEDLREKLEALGYVGGGAPAPAGASGALPDPKDRIGVYERLKAALVLRHEGRDAEAVEALRGLLDEEPAMFDAWESLASTLMRLGRSAEAIEASSRAIELDPTRPGPHLALAKLYGLERKPDLAARHAEIAARRDPGQGYELLAQLSLDRRQPEQAADYARRSLAADPRRMMSHFVLGDVARQAGRCEEAVAHYRDAAAANRLRRGSIVLGLHANAADCLARLGREAEAEQEFRAELETIPWSPAGRVGLATLYRSQGRDADAREVLAGLVAARPEPDSYWTVVRALTALGDTGAAREWASRARQRFPGDPRFRGGAR